MPNRTEVTRRKPSQSTTGRLTSPRLFSTLLPTLLWNHYTNNRCPERMVIPPATAPELKAGRSPARGSSLSLAPIQSLDPVICVTEKPFPQGYNQLIGERVKWLLPRI